MADPKIQEILTKYTEELTRRRAFENSLPVQSPESLFNRAQTLYLEKIIEEFQILLLTDASDVLRIQFSNIVSNWQRKVYNSAMSYLSAPFGDPTAPTVPANGCCYELFQLLFPNPTTTDFLKVFFPDATSYISFDEPIVIDRRAQITYNVAPLSSDVINAHPITALIIKNNLILCVADVLSGSPDLLCQYAERLRLEYPDHYAQLIKHNDQVQALYEQVALLNNSVTLSEAITRLRATLRRHGVKVTGVEGTLKPEHEKTVERAIREFQDYLAQYGETREAELGLLRGERLITLQGVINHLLGMTNEQCVEEAEGWLLTVQQNAQNRDVLADKPHLSDESKRDIKKSIAIRAERASSCSTGRNHVDHLPLIFLESVIAQIQINDFEQVVHLFEHFNSAEIYEKFFLCNKALRDLVLNSDLALLFVSLTPQQQNHLMQVLIKHRVLTVNVTEIWKFIKTVTTTEEQASRLLADVWQTAPKRETLSSQEISILFHLPAIERATFQRIYKDQIHAYLTSPEKFNKILRGLSPEICVWVCQTYASELFKILKFVRDFNVVFQSLCPNQCAGVCIGCQTLLRQITYGNFDAVLLVQNLDYTSIFRIFEICNQLSIFIIPTAEAFAYLSRQLPEIPETVLYVHFSKQLPGLIERLKDFNVIVATMKNRVNRKDFYFSCRSKLLALIKSVDDFLEILCALQIEQIKDLVCMGIEQFKAFITSARDFWIIFQYLPAEQTTRLYSASADRWLKLIDSAENFYFVACCVPEQCEAIYRASYKTLVEDIKTVAKMGAVLPGLTPQVCSMFCKEFSAQITTLISNAVALKTLLPFYQPEKCREILTFLYVVLLPILTTKKDFQTMFKPDSSWIIDIERSIQTCVIIAEIFQSALCSILSTPTALREFLQGIHFKLYSVICAVIVSHLKKIVTSIDVFAEVCAVLNPQQSAAFYEACPWLLHSIKTVDELITLWQYGNEQQRASLVAKCLLPADGATKEFISNAEAFQKLMSLETLTSEQQNQLYARYRAQLPGFIRTVTHFTHVLQPLKPEQRAEVFSACQHHRLPAIIESIQTVDELCTLLLQINQAQREIVLSACMSKLPMLISDIGDLTGEFFTWDAIQFRQHHLRIFLTDAQSSRLIAACLSKLPALITREEELNSLLRAFKCLTSAEGWREFYAVIKTKLPDLILVVPFQSRRFEQLSPIYFSPRILEQLTSEQYHDVALACQNHIVIYIANMEDRSRMECFQKLLTHPSNKARHLIIYDILQSELIKYIATTDDLIAALKMTPVERCRGLCTALDPELLIRLVPSFGELLMFGLNEESRDKKQIVIDHFKPILLVFSIAWAKTSEPFLWSFYIGDQAWQTFNADTELCNKLRDRFLTLYSENHTQAGFFKQAPRWPSLHTSSRLPTLEDILNYAKEKSSEKPSTFDDLRKEVVMQKPPCRTIQVLEQLAEELLNDFIQKHKTARATLAASPH